MILTEDETALIEAAKEARMSPEEITEMRIWVNDSRPYPGESVIPWLRARA